MSYIVEIYLADNHLMNKLREIVTWLDYKDFEPNSFRYFQEEGGVLMHVHFGIEGHAAALARRFGGRVIDRAESACAVAGIRSPPAKLALSTP